MKKKNFGEKITSMVLGVLKIQEQEDREEKEEKGMPDLLQELYDGMKESQSSVTMTMALVALKRKKLRELVNKQDAMKAQAVEMEQKGRGDLAKKLIAESINLDNAIEAATTELQGLDAQAKNEIIHFRELEKKAEIYKAKIQEAQQLDRFNKIRERVTSTTGQFNDSVLSNIGKKIEKIELKNAQLASSIALNAGKTESIMLDSEVQSALIHDRVEAEYLLLQAEVLSKEASPANEATRQIEHKPADKAKSLLDAPAFDGILTQKY